MPAREQLLLGRIAVELGFLPQVRLAECLARQAADPGADRHLGQILLERGLLTPAQLQQVVKLQRERLLSETKFLRQPREEVRFGRLAARLTWARPEQVDAALRRQMALRRQGCNACLGELLVEAGVLREEQVERILVLQGRAEIAPNALPGYCIEEKLGEGSMAAVYRARQLSMDRAVAIKVLRPALGRDAEYTRRFLLEAKAVARLSHPHIIQAIDVGRQGELHYFVMEYVAGESLRRMIFRRGRLPAAEVLSLGLQVAAALNQAHACRFVHRDVKPENILVGENGLAKLCDLGVARQQGNPFFEDGAAADRVIGTPYYMSPEQAAGGEVDIRSDLYNLGATLYHALAGLPPFLGDSVAAVLRAHLAVLPRPLREVDPGLPPALEEVVLRLLAKKPAERYPDPAALFAALDRLRRPPSAPSPAAAGAARPPAFARRPGRRR